MGFKALITMDLPNITEEQRDQFYDILKEEKWLKIKKMTTTWKVSFSDEITRDDAIIALENDIKKAKQNCRISKVEYAVQLGMGEIKINIL
jgi:hypothetical protein